MLNCELQLEVGGGVTTRQLDNLISQTEYSLAVTPVYDEGPGQPMLGTAITGRNKNTLFARFLQVKYIFINSG